MPIMIRTQPDAHKKLKRLARMDKRSMGKELEYLVDSRLKELAVPAPVISHPTTSSPRSQE